MPTGNPMKAILQLKFPLHRWLYFVSHWQELTSVSDPLSTWYTNKSLINHRFLFLVYLLDLTFISQYTAQQNFKRPTVFKFFNTFKVHGFFKIPMSFNYGFPWNKQKTNIIYFFIPRGKNEGTVTIRSRHKKQTLTLWIVHCLLSRIDSRSGLQWSWIALSLSPALQQTHLVL